MYNKNKAGYIGFYRVNNPWTAGGVWPVNQVALEVGEKDWIGNTVWAHDGTLTGWTNNGATVNATTGNPAPSLSVAATKYAYYTPTSESFLYRTFEFDVRISTGMVNFHFACTTAGQGPMLRLDTRAGKYCGIMWANSWTAFGGEPVAGLYQVTLAVNTWYKIRVEINRAARAEWWINDVRKDSSPVLPIGKYIGINGDTVGSALFDNITMYNGVR